MHWLWRLAISVLVACVYGGLSVTILQDLHETVADSITTVTGGNRGGRSWQIGISVAVAWFAPIILLAFAVFGLLTRYLGPARPADNETRCRKCGYILRGITEPRCPECGERI